MVAVGAYPGTFNPPTVAHLAIAEAARQQGGLDRLDLVVSAMPLGKDPARPPLERALAVLEAIAATRPWLGVRVTDQQLIADVAAGYDAVVVGADKWLQIVDPAWYGGSPAARDRPWRGCPACSWCLALRTPCPRPPARRRGRSMSTATTGPSRPPRRGPAAATGWPPEADCGRGGGTDRPLTAGAPTSLAPMPTGLTGPSPRVNLLYVAGGCLVVAQLLGIYGLVTRKADLIFALVMGALLVGAIVLGGPGRYHRVH